jgi:hypothetical protein
VPAELPGVSSDESARIQSELIDVPWEIPWFRDLVYGDPEEALRILLAFRSDFELIAFRKFLRFEDPWAIQSSRVGPGRIPDSLGILPESVWKSVSSVLDEWLRPAPRIKRQQAVVEISRIGLASSAFALQPWWRALLASALESAGSAEAIPFVEESLALGPPAPGAWGGDESVCALARAVHAYSRFLLHLERATLEWPRSEHDLALARGHVSAAERLFVQELGEANHLRKHLLIEQLTSMSWDSPPPEDAALTARLRQLALTAGFAEAREMLEGYPESLPRGVAAQLAARLAPMACKELEEALDRAPTRDSQPASLTREAEALLAELVELAGLPQALRLLAEHLPGAPPALRDALRRGTEQHDGRDVKRPAGPRSRLGTKPRGPHKPTA